MKIGIANAAVPDYSELCACGYLLTFDYHHIIHVYIATPPHHAICHVLDKYGITFAGPWRNCAPPFHNDARFKPINRLAFVCIRIAVQ
jgi:hypothetical protein